MSVNSKMKAIADAIRSKTGQTEALSLDAMAAAIANIPVGSSSNAESGTAQMTAGNYYGYSIPVSSPKSHLVIWPESISYAMETDYTNRFIFLYAVAGDGHVQAALDNSAGNSTRSGTIAWYNTDETNEGKVVFGNNSIEVTIAGGIWRAGAYHWYAW